MINEDNIAVCVVGNFKFLRRHLNKFILQVRENGCYEGDIVVLTSKYTPSIFLKIKNKANLKFLRFKKIDFDNTTNNILKTIDTNGQPNRHIHKRFQWHKVHLFDTKLKKWKYIFYIDINMSIHKDINPILRSKPEGLLYANRDASDQHNWKLRNQFDTNHQKFNVLAKKYDLNIDNYFQTGMLYFDTDIVNFQTKNDLLDLIKLYPISRTNEQAIMNLYFIFNKNLYRQLPKKIDNVDTYSYWKSNDNTRITKQLVPQYK